MNSYTYNLNGEKRIAYMKRNRFLVGGSVLASIRALFLCVAGVYVSTGLKSLYGTFKRGYAPCVDQ